jgi:hypothetical protein
MGLANRSSSSSSSNAAREQEDEDDDDSGNDESFRPPVNDDDERDDDDDEDEVEDEDEDEQADHDDEGEEGARTPSKNKRKASAAAARTRKGKFVKHLKQQPRYSQDHMSNGLEARLSAYQEGYKALTTGSPSSSSASNGDGSSPSCASASSCGTEKRRLKNEKMLIHCFAPEVLLKGVDVIATELARRVWGTVRFSTPFLEDEAALYSCAEELYPTVMESLGRSVTDLPFTLFWNPPVAASKIQGIKGGKAYVYRKVRDKRISKLQILVGCRFPCTSI